MTRSDGADGPVGPDGDSFQSLLVGDIMTSPAVSAGESTHIKNLSFCKIQTNKRLTTKRIIGPNVCKGIYAAIHQLRVRIKIAVWTTL